MSLGINTRKNVKEREHWTRGQRASVTLPDGWLQPPLISVFLQGLSDACHSPVTHQLTDVGHSSRQSSGKFLKMLFLTLSSPCWGFGQVTRLALIVVFLYRSGQRRWSCRSFTTSAAPLLNIPSQHWACCFKSKFSWRPARRGSSVDSLYCSLKTFCCFGGQSWNTCSGVPDSAVHWMLGAVTLTQEESFQMASCCCSGWGPREDGFLCFFLLCCYHTQLLSSFRWLQHLQCCCTLPPGHRKHFLWENKRGKSKQNNFYYFPSYYSESTMFIFYSSLS